MIESQLNFLLNEIIYFWCSIGVVKCEKNPNTMP